MFIASMANINKTLYMKKYSDFWEKLSKYFHHYLQTFNCKATDQLSSLCNTSVDYKIKLISNKNGKTPDILYSFLYQMSREELLVLQKTLIKYLNKEFI